MVSGNTNLGCVWLPSNDVNVFVKATVLALKGEGLMSVRTAKGKLVTVNEDDVVYVDELAVPGTTTDLVRLDPPHLSNILHLLRMRSTLEESPYTFVGPVLVSVNPLLSLIKTKSGKLVEGEDSETLSTPHPFRIAEAALKQMHYAKFTGQPANQAIVISGESGAGKTEAAKRVLQRLVSNAEHGKGKCSSANENRDLDRRLLDTNPVLEAFGNAATLRNPNSSRFGKYLKLHFEHACISGASVQTFLLERARVTGFVQGECNYHIFYQLLMGISFSSSTSSGFDAKALRSRLGLPFASSEDAINSVASFNYLNHRMPTTSKTSKKSLIMSQTQQTAAATTGVGGTSVYQSLRLASVDKSGFIKVVNALASVGIPEKERGDIFAVVAAVLHLGNVLIGTSSSSDSDDAYINGSENGSAQATLKRTATLVGVNPTGLKKVLCERSMKVAGEVVTKRVSVADARRTRDAAGKQMYSYLFDYIVLRINQDLSPDELDVSKSGSLRDVEDQPGDPTSKANKQQNKTGLSTIGVLDIFGFETFMHNGLTQLLIAFSATLLHGVFLQKIFDAELSLYLSEGLLTDNEDVLVSVPENKQTVELLLGIPSKKQRGLLDVIVDQGRMPLATDTLMNRALHREFEGHISFPKPHPKDVDHIFKVVHFAGVVSYTVGSFLEMNHDHLPEVVDSLFKASNNPVVKSMWTDANPPVDGNNNKHKRSPSKRTTMVHKSVISKFKLQIESLCDTLSISQCSFIRCIKPNFFMEREPGSSDWFEPAYVNAQLQCLGIEPTVQVLSQGLPNRVPYLELFEAFKDKLPKECIVTWERLGGGHRSFIAALLAAFNIPPTKCKLGFTLVFFRTGDMQEVEKLLKVAEDAGDTNNKDSKRIFAKIGKKFKRCLVRAKWRKCLAAALAAVEWLAILERVRDHQARVMEHLDRCIVTVQSLVRGKLGRDAAERRRKNKLAKAKKTALEAELRAKAKRVEEAGLRAKAAKAKQDAIERAFKEDERKRCNILMDETLAFIRQSRKELGTFKKEQKHLEKVKKDLDKAEQQVKQTAKLLERVNKTHKQADASAKRDDIGLDAMREQVSLLEHSRFKAEGAVAAVANAVGGRIAGEAAATKAKLKFKETKSSKSVSDEERGGSVSLSDGEESRRDVKRRGKKKENQFGRGRSATSPAIGSAEVNMGDVEAKGFKWHNKNNKNKNRGARTRRKTTGGSDSEYVLEQEQEQEQEQDAETSGGELKRERQTSLASFPSSASSHSSASLDDATKQQRLESKMKRERHAARLLRLQHAETKKRVDEMGEKAIKADVRAAKSSDSLARLSLGGGGRDLTLKALEIQRDLFEVEATAEEEEEGARRAKQEAEKAEEEAALVGDGVSSPMAKQRKERLDNAEQIMSRNRASTSFRKHSMNMLRNQHKKLRGDWGKGDVDSNPRKQSGGKGRKNSKKKKHRSGEEEGAEDDDGMGGLGERFTMAGPPNLTMQPIRFWAVKRARHSARNWKKRFFVLSKADNELVYYSKDSGGLRGGHGSKGVLRLTEATRTELTSPIRKHKDVLRIDDPSSGPPMFLAFPSKPDAQRIKYEIDRTVKRLQTTSVEAMISGTGARAMADALKIDHDYIDQLIELRKRDLISEEELENLLNHREAVLAFGGINMNTGDPQDLDMFLQVFCDACQKANNTAYGPRCRNCKTVLPVSPEQFL